MHHWIYRTALATAIVGITLQSTPLLAEPNFFLDETPVYNSITSPGFFGTQSAGFLSLAPDGVVVEVDGDGNYYHGTASKIAKYSPEGVLQWSQLHTQYTWTHTIDGLTKSYQYDDWENHLGQNDRIQVGNGDEGTLATLRIQKLVVDGEGDVYASFMDLIHRDRSLLVKFDGVSGAIEWFTRTAPPHEELGYNEEYPFYVSKVVDLLVLPDGSVALLETGVGSGRWVFTRLMIFASQGASRAGVVIRGDFRETLANESLVYRNDGGPTARDSIAVGMAVDASGNLYYATFEGTAPTPWPVFPDPFPAPDKLVVRKLAPPYTAAPLEVVHDSNGVDHWNDLAIGPGGNVYVLGTDFTGDNSEPVLAGFGAVSLGENVFSRKRYPATLVDPTLPIWNAEGMKIHATGTNENSSLYLVSGEADFRSQERPFVGQYFWATVDHTAPRRLSVFKVNGSGDVIWGKYDNASIYDSFIDEANHLYLIGTNSAAAGVGIYKYSESGVLQLGENVDADNGRGTYGHFSGTLDSLGNIVVAFPQFNPAGGQTDSSKIVLFDNPAIGKRSQTITMDPLPPYAYVGDPVVLRATSSSGLPVSFRITSGEATLFTDLFNGLSVGTVTVEAYEEGNGAYAAATPVSQSVLIKSANVGGGDGGAAGGNAILSISGENNLSFGGLRVGKTSKAAEIVIRNAGVTPLLISAIRFKDKAKQNHSKYFKASPKSFPPIAPGTVVVLKVYFKPSGTKGVRSTNLEIISNASNVPVMTYPVKGIAKSK